MKKYLALLFIAIFAIGTSAQVAQNTKGNSSKIVSISSADDAAAMEIAKATLQAHGGDKLVNYKTLVLRGSAELSAPGAPGAIPAAFATIFSGVKFRLDIQSPFFNFNQISDGTQSYSSIGNFSLPMDKAGLSLLAKMNQSGFAVSSLPEKLKKKKGFRITSPEGYYTDYIVDEKTSQVKEFESSYMVNNSTLSTSVIVDKYREVDGLLIYEKFSQRLDTPQGSFYAAFKAKDILVNSDVSDDVFLIPGAK